MLKNNRPYTINVDGSIDNELVTDLSSEQINTFMRWIRENVRPADTEYPETSYGLKHKLEHDTGLYVTNNMFKDGMRLAGFEPVDPNELNWKYRIIFPCETIFNSSPFVAWLKDKHFGKDTRFGDFAADTAADADFPVFAEHDVIAEYLGSVSAWSRDLEIFEELWNEYEARAES